MQVRQGVKVGYDLVFFLVGQAKIAEERRAGNELILACLDCLEEST